MCVARARATKSRQEVVRLGQRVVRADGDEDFDARQQRVLDGLEVVALQVLGDEVSSQRWAVARSPRMSAVRATNGVHHFQVLGGFRGDDELPQSGGGAVGFARANPEPGRPGSGRRRRRARR